ncbi:hypothetical protein NQZ68_011401 [Dissostichus eleginoides]|nr:hypothetical protein NQZ68_011401 [Dissostichus eleginoides]
MQTRLSCCRCLILRLQRSWEDDRDLERHYHLSAKAKEFNELFTLHQVGPSTLQRLNNTEGTLRPGAILGTEVGGISQDPGQLKAMRCS